MTTKATGARAAERKARARKIIARLKREYPDATCALQHRSALELVVATILSAQGTDARVNMVTPHLFAKYRTAADYAAADPRVLEKEIQSTGFFRNKTKSIIGMAQALVERHGGDVPRSEGRRLRRGRSACSGKGNPVDRILPEQNEIDHRDGAGAGRAARWRRPAHDGRAHRAPRGRPQDRQ